MFKEVCLPDLNINYHVLKHHMVPTNMFNFYVFIKICINKINYNSIKIQISLTKNEQDSTIKTTKHY
jgi:hypothetical protein